MTPPARPRRARVPREWAEVPAKVRRGVFTEIESDAITCDSLEANPDTGEYWAERARALRLAIRELKKAAKGKP